MEVAGLVLGIVATWKSCVELFDLISDSRKYGIDYEIYRVKLEVERVRLLAWGNAVGLSGLEREQQHADARFNQEHTRTVVVQVLSCIQRLFEDTTRLQDRYGLIQEVVRPELGVLEPTSGLPLVFRRAYATLKTISRERQRTANLQQKATWVIHDKARFLKLVTEVRNFVDSLTDIFPDLHIREALKTEINQSVEISPLDLLQQASADDDADLSDTVSMRLDALGATATARSSVTQGPDDRTETSGRTTPRRASNTQAEPANGADNDTTDATDRRLEEVKRKFEAIESFIEKQREGGLYVSFYGPHSYSAKVTAYVGWIGHNTKDPFYTLKDRDRGFVKQQHASFQTIYYQRRYQKNKKEYDEINASEASVLIDPESNPKYEHVNTGTVTVEGFALECWEHAERTGKGGDRSIFVSAAAIPNIQASQLLRRIDDLQHRPSKLGWSPDLDMVDLQEFLPSLLDHAGLGEEYEIYNWLNRRDLVVDITTGQPLCLLWSDRGKVWNLLWVLIIARELGRRMEELWPRDGWVAGFTGRVLLSVITADSWFKNVLIVQKPLPSTTSNSKSQTSPEDQAASDRLKEKGNESLAAKNYQDAVDHYTKAIEIDATNAIYRCNRAAAFACQDKHEESFIDASAALELKPEYAKAWARLGAALAKLKNLDDALEAYSTAIRLSGDNATNAMVQGRENTLKLIKELNEKIETEKDRKKQHKMIIEQQNTRWLLLNHDIQFHSRVHERQTEALLFFAERMRWPYLNEMRDRAEDAYHDLRSGTKIHPLVIDWCFGLTLPGIRAAHNIMSTLILCTPSIMDHVGQSGYLDTGLVVKKYSYWPIRSVLGRILGTLSGVHSMCGWIGPCPAVEFLPKNDDFQPRHVRLKARKVAPIKETKGDDDVIYIGHGYDEGKNIRLGDEEDPHAYITEMSSRESYLTLEPPVRQLGTVKLESVRLKKLAPEALAQSRHGHSPASIDREDEFRASLVFSIDNNEAPISYTLYTNPIFVAAPPCYSGPHKIHQREVKRFEMRHWEVARLKDHVPEDSEGEKLMVVNATDRGADTLARAWCSERGKLAMVRREGGACLVCAIRCAIQLGVDVLIWTD